jgi:hypothetical protein
MKGKGEKMKTNLKLIVLALMLSGCSSTFLLSMKPYENITKINMNKTELMTHIRAVTSNYFVSGKTVIDNEDTATGLFQIKFIASMADEWGVPYVGSGNKFLDRGIDCQMNVYVKDGGFKVEIIKFIARSQEALEIYQQYQKKKQEDFDAFQKHIVDSYCKAIAEQKSDNKWNF